MKKIIITVILLCLFGCGNVNHNESNKEEPDYLKREEPYHTVVNEDEEKLVTCLNPFTVEKSYSVVITKNKESNSNNCEGRVVLFANEQEIASFSYTQDFGTEINYEDYEINWSTKQCTVELLKDGNVNQTIRINTEGKVEVK